MLVGLKVSDPWMSFGASALHLAGQKTRVAEIDMKSLNLSTSWRSHETLTGFQNIIPKDSRMLSKAPGTFQEVLGKFQETKDRLPGGSRRPGRAVLLHVCFKIRFLGGSGRLQSAPGSSRTLQDSPGGCRRLQGGSREAQEGSRRLQGGSREAPGGSREAPGKAYAP